jgi:hypothetical protein
MSNEVFNSRGAQHDFVWEGAARSSQFGVKFPNTPAIELILIGAELFQTVNSHDVLVLQFKGKPFLDSTRIVSGDPVVFTWSTGPNESSFNGYVYDLDPETGTSTNNTTITCVAASYVLKNTDQQIYKNATADSVVAKICKKHGLNTITERHPRIREQVVQAGQSDWQMLQRLAKQCGFALRAENTTIYFLSKNKIYGDKKASAPYFKYNDGVTKAQRMYGTCFMFKPELSDESPDRAVIVDRVVSGFSVNTGDVIATTHQTKDHTISVNGSVIPSEDYFLYGI